ncbi:MAG: hypothetical protein ACRESK_09350 [Gammaproteobacteria bacterium]
MREIYFGEFRLTVIRHIREIEAGSPESHTTEWFLLKYLRRIEKNANPPTIPGRMENSMRGMIRFYVDQIDERTALGERCRLIYDAYVRTLRESKEDK